MAGIFTTFVMDILERTLPVEVTRPIIAAGYGPTPLLYRCQITHWRALLYRARTQAPRGLAGSQAVRGYAVDDHHFLLSRVERD